MRALTIFLLLAAAALLQAIVLLSRPPNDAIPREAATVDTFIGVILGMVVVRDGCRPDADKPGC
jgi:hypothetical protein